MASNVHVDDVFEDEITRRYWEWVCAGRKGSERPWDIKPRDPSTYYRGGRKTERKPRQPPTPPAPSFIQRLKAERKANPPPWLVEMRKDREKYREKNRKKIECYRAYNEALRKGTLVRPDKCSVDDENCRGRIEGHHEDYDKPLDVEWLCNFHHRERHG